MDNIDNILKNNGEIETEMKAVWAKESEMAKKETEAVHDMLVAMGGEISVDFDCDEYPTVIYDGGNHSEYASTINGVFKVIRATEERGFKLFEVDFDEEKNYSSNRFCLTDIDCIFDYVRTKFSEKVFDEYIEAD